MTNEITQIIELIQTLGEEGKSAFVWWLAMKYGAGFMGKCLVAGTIVFIVYRGAHLISDLNKPEAPKPCSVEQRIVSILGMDELGEGGMFSMDRTAFFKWLHENRESWHKTKN